MPKIFDRQDLPKTIKRINEDVWFDLFQPLLLKIVNTDYGRDLLCIKKEPFPIVFIRKNEVRYYLGRYNGRDYFMSDFRVGAKWANVIRYRWWDFRAYAKKFYEKELYGQKIYLPLLKYRGQYIAAHVTDTFYPDPDPELTSVDGFVRKQNSGSWPTTRNASSGQEVFDALTSIQCAAGFESPNYRLSRAYLLFDTSLIPDGDTIDSAILSLMNSGGTPNSENSLHYIVSSNPASNTALALGDYSRIGATSFGTLSSYPVNIYVDVSLNSDGKNNISKTGVSKFGVRSKPDFEDFAPTGYYEGPNWYAADQTGTSQDPKLVVVYSAAAVAAKSRGFIFG